MDTTDPLAMSVREFLSATAAKTPTPGGGSVAALVAALGASLAQMSLGFSVGKKALAPHAEYHTRLGERLDKYRLMFETLVSEDIAAFELYQQANAMNAGSEKNQALQHATAAAVNVPRELAKVSLKLLEDLAEFADKCNRWLITDLLAAGALAVASVTLSDYNVRINLPNVTDPAVAGDIRQSSSSDLARAKTIHGQIEESTKDMLG